MDNNQQIPPQMPLPTQPLNKPRFSHNILRLIGLSLSVLSIGITIAVVGYLWYISKHTTVIPKLPQVSQKPTSIPTLPFVNITDWKTYTASEDYFGTVSFQYSPNYTIQDHVGSGNPNWLNIRQENGTVVVSASIGVSASNNNLSGDLNGYISGINYRYFNADQIKLTREYNVTSKNLNWLLRIYGDSIRGYAIGMAYLGYDKRAEIFPNKDFVEFQTLNLTTIPEMEGMIRSLQINNQHAATATIASAIIADIVNNRSGLQATIVNYDGNFASGFYTGTLNKNWIAKKGANGWVVIWEGYQYPDCSVRYQYAIPGDISICGTILTPTTNPPK